MNLQQGDGENSSIEDEEEPTAAVEDNDQATLAPTVRAGVDDGAMVVETKTYDVSVTYDVYYSVSPPSRLWVNFSVLLCLKTQTPMPPPPLTSWFGCPDTTGVAVRVRRIPQPAARQGMAEGLQPRAPEQDGHLRESPAPGLLVPIHTPLQVSSTPQGFTARSRLVAAFLWRAYAR